ncbi:MAG: UDP-N-acetylmuramoyl-L-alanyl-D-glutamate--2,6-diaminopimelate ligase [Planctomycetota bacterium]|nr:UDP-N-acetylmuramoyl-L-alanyl-D-glutamate--2,6-diaminopimelate ligase [Planctomycetota bacterium]
MASRRLKPLRIPLDRAALEKILGTPCRGTVGASPIQLLCRDHRQMPADLFVAIRGTQHDASQFIDAVIDGGVCAIVTESEPLVDLPDDIVWWQVADARQALAQLEQAGAGSPGSRLRIFGITGTNGKSTTVRYLSNILEKAGHTVGWMTTVENKIGATREPSRMTTQEPARIASALARHLEGGGSDFVLEISSHGIDQNRIGGLSLAAGAITSLGRDHLDYHETIDRYHATKESLQKFCDADAPFVRPVSTAADSVGSVSLRFEVVGFGEAQAESIESTITGQRARIRTPGFEGEVCLRQPGRHNLSNALVAIALAGAIGIDRTAIAAGIEKAEGVAGRLEEIEVEQGQVFVDFAHTPDAIDAVIASMRPLVRGRLMVLFGCGGERDRGKRSEMGASASKADRLIVTSDNPRSEDPLHIIEQIREGIVVGTDHIIEVDRRRAIQCAIEMLEEDDVLLIAGKGHEQTQQSSGIEEPFDDRTVAREIIAARQQGRIIG